MFNLSQKNYNIYDRLLLIVALTMAIGGLVYYLYALDRLGIIIALILIVFLFWKTRRYFSSPEKFAGQVKRKDIIALLSYILVYLILIVILFSSRSDRSLISPWQVISTNFFWLYILASSILAWLMTRPDLGKTGKLILLSLHYFLSFSVAAVVYRIGYGFDPFIHQATMELIDAKGAVSPKTPYYLGQYGLIIIFHKLSGLSVAILNRFLVPGLAALLLPTALYRFLSGSGRSKNSEPEHSNIFLTMLFLLILTFSPFIVTTPQNLSYIFLILTIISGFGADPWQKTAILAIATAAIHPLTGLPALAWTGLLIMNEYREAISRPARKYFRLAVWLFSALALPLALFFASGHSLKRGAAILSSFADYLGSLIGSPGTAGREDWLANLVYFFAYNYQLLILILVGGLVLYAWLGRKDRDNYKTAATRDMLLLASGLSAAYLLSGLINFSDLINYEQADYAKRIPIIILIFFLPFIVLTLRRLIGLIRQQENLSRLIWLAIGVSALGSSLYLSYPRFDKYWNSRGYSTGQNDIKAVEFIAEKSDRPYVALANQQVSAAALKEFGFDHYFSTGSGPVYFYPIPTGGPLYQFYLDMVYKSPSRESMIKALRLTGAQDGYLIVNKYWYQSDRVINEAKLKADKWWTINNEVYIFLYRG
jgi:hypothetical protein